MKWVNRLAATLVGLVGIGVIREFFNRYDVLVFDKNDIEEAIKKPVAAVKQPVKVLKFKTWEISNFVDQTIKFSGDEV